MTRVINAREAAELVSQEVRYRGKDYRYKDHHSSCRYMARNKETGTPEPGCIVGGVLYRQLGLTGYNESCEGVFDTAVTSISALNDIRFTDAAVLVLVAAQGVQDAGGTHGEAETVAMRIRSAVYGMGVSDE